MNRTQTSLALLLPLALLAACKAPSQLPTGTSAFGETMSAAAFAARAGVISSVSKNGGASVLMDLRVLESAGPALRLLALPTNWTEAVVKLFSPTASTAFDESLHSKTVVASGFTQNGTDPSYSTTLTFGALKPASDYQVQVFLKNTAGTIETKRLAASSSQSAVALAAGPNAVTVDITLNGSEATYEVASSATNATTGGYITKGDTVTLATGIANNQPGVSYVLFKLSGAAYGTPADPVTIGKLTDATAFATFTWDTSADNTADGASYTAASLVGGADAATVSGQVDVEAYNANDLLVGKASFPISVFGAANVSVKVH